SAVTSPQASSRSAGMTHAESPPFGDGMGGPKKQFASTAHAARVPPQSASVVHAPSPSVPAPPLIQWVVALAPSVQVVGPLPFEPARLMPPAEIPTTSRIDTPPSGKLTPGRLPAYIQ